MVLFPRDMLLPAVTEVGEFFDEDLGRRGRIERDFLLHVHNLLADGGNPDSTANARHLAPCDQGPAQGGIQAETRFDPGWR